MLIHVVSSGQSLYSIARSYGVSPNLLAVNNGIADPNRLVVGQTLVIQQPLETHTVQPGESLSSIASIYRTSSLQLYRNNYQLKGMPMLYPGQTLVITQEGEKWGSIETNSYAYPYISQGLLRQQLPYLSWFTPFTYGFTSNGDLVTLRDQTLLNTAKDYGCAPLLHFSTLTEEGNFDSDMGHMLLQDLSMQERIIEQLVQLMETKGYKGIDVDFEYLPPEDHVNYPAFLEKLTSRLNPLGYQVFSALAPKTFAEQRGILYEAHNYEAIGRAVNGVLLMTYEWGYRYSEPMPVAPLPNVTAVLEFAASQIPNNKIFLGIPLYGYDWPLPFVAGQTQAQSISCERAVELARDHQSAIEYDTRAQAPHFRYRDRGGQQHEVWFEDARSIDAKLRLISQYNLRGAGYWNLMRPFAQSWVLLNGRLNIKQIP